VVNSLIKIIAGFIIIVGAGLSAAGQESAEWKRFVSTEGHFSVLLPQAPDVHAVPLTSSSGITVLLNMTLIPGNDGDLATYMVSYVDYSVDLDEGSIDAMRDGGLKRGKATLVREKKISLNGYVGREVEAMNEISFLQFRIFLVGRRSYYVAYAWSKQADQTLAFGNATKYFASFELDRK
jgi:hypothetical protein